jgi:hypothetical protein
MFIALYVLICSCFDGTHEDKKSKLNSSKHSLNLICSKCSYEYNFDLLLLFPSAWNLSYFQGIDTELRSGYIQNKIDDLGTFYSIHSILQYKSYRIDRIEYHTYIMDAVYKILVIYKHSNFSFIFKPVFSS